MLICHLSPINLERCGVPLIDKGYSPNYSGSNQARNYSLPVPSFLNLTQSQTQIENLQVPSHRQKEAAQRQNAAEADNPRNSTIGFRPSAAMKCWAAGYTKPNLQRLKPNVHDHAIYL